MINFTNLIKKTIKEIEDNNSISIFQEKRIKENNKEYSVGIKVLSLEANRVAMSKEFRREKSTKEKLLDIWFNYKTLSLVLGLVMFPLLVFLYMARDLGIKSVVILLIVIPFYYGLKHIKFEK